MPGSPMKRRMLIELEKRAKAAGEGVTPIDYVCEYIAAGADEDGTLHTLAELARDITSTVGLPVSGGVLTNWANSTVEWKAKLAAARALAAHVFAEGSVGVLDELAGTEVTREEVALAKARSDVRQWLASKWNRGQYGADASVVVNNTQISAPGAHLDALRARAERAKLKAQTQPMLPPAEPDYEMVIEHEVIPAPVSEGDDMGPNTGGDYGKSREN